MRCSKCGHENPEGMKYCMYCGSQLVQADSSLLYQTALGYTGSASAAEKISAENKDMHTLSLACIAWIREQEPALFDQLQDGDDSRTMETLEDFSQLRQLDYEERICLLLRTEDKENIEDIAKLLNLTSSQVRYYLQSAWKKNHPDLSSKQRKAEEKEKIDDENYRPAGPSFRKMKPIIWKSILAAMVVFICAGSNPASDQCCKLWRRKRCGRKTGQSLLRKRSIRSGSDYFQKAETRRSKGRSDPDLSGNGQCLH